MFRQRRPAKTLSGIEVRLDPQDHVLVIRKSLRRMLNEYLLAGFVCCLGGLEYVTGRFGPSMPFPVLWLLLFAAGAVLACAAGMLSYWFARDHRVVLGPTHLEVVRFLRSNAWRFDHFSAKAWLELHTRGGYYDLCFDCREEPSPSSPAPPASEANAGIRRHKIALCYVSSHDSRRLLDRLNERLGL